MLILPPGHAQAITQSRRLRTREKWFIGSALGLVAAALVALVISLASASPSSGKGCIHVTVQYVTGGTQLDRCGAEARSVCASIGLAGGYAGAIGEAVAKECRKAGLPTHG